MGLEVYLGPCTDMRNHFCSSESPELSGLGHRFAIGVTEEETGREQIARARYVNDFVHGIGRCRVDPVVVDYNAARGGSRKDGDRAILGDGLHGAIEILGQVERLDLRLIGKDNINVVTDKIEEALAVTFDAE